MASSAVVAPPRRLGVVKWAIATSVASLVALVFVAGLLVTGDDTATDGAATGLAPRFAFPDVNDETRTVSLPEGRPTVLWFFASWCVPCREELPIVEELARSRTDVAFVGLNHLDHRDDARAFMAAHGASRLPAAHDPGGQTLLDYRLRGLPATVFIGADGRIAEILHGQLDRDTLVEKIDELVLQNRKD